MFFSKTPDEDSNLQKAIDSVFDSMKAHRKESTEYVKMVDQLTKLYALKTIDRPERVSKDTLAIIAANLTGIILIVGYERTHLVASKAITFVQKLR